MYVNYWNLRKIKTFLETMIKERYIYFINKLLPQNIDNDIIQKYMFVLLLHDLH